jgi:hypothetical protein
MTALARFVDLLLPLSNGFWLADDVEYSQYGKLGLLNMKRPPSTP